MKFILNTLICLLIIGCSSETEKKEQSESKPKEITPTKFVNLSENHIGFWVNEEYYKALKESNSTKIAGESGNDDFYRISEVNSIMNMNIHEGAAENLILMDSENKGQIFNSDTTESYSKVEFQNGILLTDNKKYIKAPIGENGLNELVNSAFISGKYLLNGIEIEFKANGTLTGLDSIKNFELNLDYNDAGMQYDKIYLQFNNEKETRTYLYSFNSDTLTISKIDCKTQAEDYDYCLEVEKGETIFKLIKK
jgi:hypothetical protein